MTELEQKQWFDKEMQKYAPFYFSQFKPLLDMLMAENPEINPKTRCVKTSHFGFKVRIFSKPRYSICDDDIFLDSAYPNYICVDETRLDLEYQIWFEKKSSLIYFFCGCYCRENDTLYVHSSGVKDTQD